MIVFYTEYKFLQCCYNQSWIKLNFLCDVKSCRCVAKRYKTLVIISRFTGCFLEYTKCVLFIKQCAGISYMMGGIAIQFRKYVTGYSPVMSKTYWPYAIPPYITNRVPTHKQIPILIPLFIARHIPFSVNVEHGWDQFSTLTYGIRNISLVPIFSLFKLDEEI